MDQTITLRTGAWFGDRPLELSFPAGWELVEVGAPTPPDLSDEQVAAAIAHPVGGPPLAELARGKRQVAILVDDLTRPTPADRRQQPILAELRAAGINESAIRVVIAGGTHPPATPDEIQRKLGADLAQRLTVIPHDSSRNLRDLGRTPAGLPLLINEVVAGCDLKIGVGCIYPHPAAGFSGGAKILMPGVCGAETTRMMHDYLRGATQRGGSLVSELRREIEAAAARVGLNFIVNIVFNHDRRPAGVFAGDRNLAHAEGVSFFLRHFQVVPPADVDIVIADMYPFDTSLQFAYDRGLWPVLDQGRGISRVVIAACSQGLGSHELYPVNRPLLARLIRRLRNLRPRDLRDPIAKLQTIGKLMGQRRENLMVLAPGVSAPELQQVFSHGTHFQEWAELRRSLEDRHTGRRARVAVYRCAPLHLPSGNVAHGTRRTATARPASPLS